MEKKYFSRLTHFICICVIAFTISFPTHIYAEQPASDLNPDIYSRFLTGWFEEDDLEIIPNGDTEQPDPVVVLSEDLPSSCVTGEPNQCEGTAEVLYPKTNLRKTEKFAGTCRPIRVEQGTGERIEVGGRCNYDKRPSLEKNYIGADTSATTNIPLPKWQSYSKRFNSPGCQYKNNPLSCGIHDIMLAQDYQAQLRLSLAWKAFRTRQTYDNRQNVRHEMPVRGVNWKENVPCKNPNTGVIEQKSLIELWGEIPGEFQPSGDSIEESYQKIWGKFPTAPGEKPWFADWLERYKVAKQQREPWTEYFGCIPLYPHDTNEPTLAIGSIVIGKTDGQWVVPYNEAVLTKDLGAKASFEANLIQNQILFPKTVAESIADKAYSISRPLRNYFEKSGVSFQDTPCMLVHGNAQICANGGSDEAATITPYKAVGAILLGRILDRNNIYFNSTNPPPRTFDPITTPNDKQEADAVHSDSSSPSLIVRALEVVRRFVPVAIRDYIICGPYCQANRVLEKGIYQSLTTRQELEDADKSEENPTNVIPDDKGGMSATSERSLNIKLSYSRLMACDAPGRADYANTPKQVADGTAVNSCGEQGGDDNASCNGEPNFEQAARQAEKETGIPASWLLAIKTTETGDTQETTCAKNSANAVGPMQIVDSTYDYITCASERVSHNELKCERPEGKLSRCNPNDSMLLAARVIQWKLGQSNFCSPQKTAGLTTRELYYAVNNYYGTCNPDPATSGWNIPGLSRTPNYGDIVCYLAGQQSTCNSFPQCP